MRAPLKKFSAELTPEIADYILKTFSPEDEALKEIKTRTQKSGLPVIQVGPMDGLHLEVLTRAMGVKRAVEIGTLAGYSGVCIARGLLPGGKLYTFEADSKHVQEAQKSFKKAGVSELIEIFTGPALDCLPQIEKFGPFDLVFIDADKANYPRYLEWAHAHLKTGGVVIGDNTLAWGMITETEFKHEEDRQAVQGLRSFNEKAAMSGHFRATILPTGEGLTVAVKI